MTDSELSQFASLGLMLCVASLVSLTLRKHKWAHLILWVVDVSMMLYRTDFFQKYPVHTWTPGLLGVKTCMCIATVILGFRYPTVQHVLAWSNFAVTAILLIP